MDIVLKTSLFKNLFSFLFTFIGFSSLYGQNYTVSRYADDSGLPSRIVRDVIQDSQGFIWVAGNNGLYRFDGQKFKPFLASLKDTIGLRDNKINALIQASDSKIWIGTPKGLHVLERGNIKHVELIDNPSENEEYVLSVFEDDQQNIWVGTYGGLFLIENSKEPIHFLDEIEGTSISKGVIWAVTEDNSGRVWVAGNDGPYIKNEQNPFSFDKVTLSVDTELQDKDIGYYKFQQYSDSLFLIDSNLGLLKGKSNGNLLQVSRFLDIQGEKLDFFFVEHSIVDKQGNVWVGTDKQSFKKFRIVDERLVEGDVVSKNGFLNMSGTVKSIYEDIQGNIWIANTNGLYKLSVDNNQISTFPPRYEEEACLDGFYGIYAIIEDKGGHLWVTTPKKLYRFKKSDILQNKCPEDYLVFENEHMHLVRNLFIDSDNRIWLGADGGLFVSQLDALYTPGPFKRYTVADGLPHNWSYEVHEMEKNRFWVGNYGGLVQLELQDGTLENPLIKVYTASNDEKDRLVNTQAIDIENDANGNTWIGTFSGVSRLLDESDLGTFENYTSDYSNSTGLSNNSIKKIFKDSKGHIWVATQRGLNLYNEAENNFVQFGHAEGLPSEYILGIQEDSKRFLWIGTTNGVLRAKYEEELKGFIDAKHYTSNNGLADNIPYKNSIWIDDRDNIFIGSREGISIFNNYGQVSMGISDFDMAITDMESTQKKDMRFTSIFEKIENNSIVLSHTENSLKLRYAVLDFVNPGDNRYRHKFLPVNNNWIETGRDSELSYYNLSPGEYELLLDGSNTTGNWSRDPLRFKLVVLPPFWKSKWAIALYILFGGCILWGIYRLQIQRKKDELERQVQLETAVVKEREALRQENAADFHDELGSILTKVSLFVELAERNVHDKKDPTPLFGKINNNLKGLSVGFRDLLWVIDPKKDSVEDTFLRLKDFGEDLFDNSDIDFRTSRLKSTYRTYLFSPQVKKQLMMIFKEALTNSAKYSNGTEVKLVLELENDSCRLQCIDNGEGFNLNVKSKGRGLKNMALRAEKIEADLKIESSQKGTNISLTRIPHMGDVYYMEDD